MSRARQSMYPAPPSASHWSALEQCSQALHASCVNVHDAVVVLDQATSDLQRLGGVVHSRRSYDLITEPDVWSAQRALANEMSPRIEELIGRAESGLEALKARERELRAKLDKRTAAALPSPAPSPTAVPTSELDALEQRLAQLQHRKERLGREVELLDERAERAALGRGPGRGAAARA
ncbi:hypothetical protein JCM9279_006603 [Rhodotorula babjevae]